MTGVPTLHFAEKSYRNYYVDKEKRRQGNQQTSRQADKQTSRQVDNLPAWSLLVLSSSQVANMQQMSRINVGGIYFSKISFFLQIQK